MLTYNHFHMKTLDTENSEQILRENEQMKKVIDLAILARNEHSDLVHVVDLLATKPKNLKLTRIDVDRKNITVEGFAVDSNLFNEYTESKRKQTLFHDLKIEKITAVGNKSPYKTVIIRSEIVGAGGGA